MSAASIDPPARATVYDDALSWLVPSRTDPHATHKVELGDYAGNGRCSCSDFQFNLEPLLAKGYTPERAVAERLARIRDYHLGPADALRCYHIITARANLATRVIEAFQAANAAHKAASPDGA